MKTLYLDCGMGVAGDMLTAALYELLDENEKGVFIEQMNTSGIPNVVMTAEKVVKCGIEGTYMKVSVNGEEEKTPAFEHEFIHGSDYTHGHISHTHDYDEGHMHNHNDGHTCGHDDRYTHDHACGYCRNGMKEIEHIVEFLPFSEQVRCHSIEVYKLIAQAESHAHGVPVSEVHFHEVGAMDAVADVTAVCLLMEKLNIEKVIASPIHIGGGHVHCAHGILPVPAPATACILKDVPIYGGDIKGELCTPTGAALLKYFAVSFGEMPVMKVERIGYGMGKKDFPIANCVRAMFGETVG